MSNIKNSIRLWILKRRENKSNKYLNKWSGTLDEMFSMEKTRFEFFNNFKKSDKNETDKLVINTISFIVKINQFNTVMGLYKDDPEMCSKLLSMF